MNLYGITFRQLQVFMEVVGAGSFRACAEKLDINQVSVSGHVRSLERQLGALLFERKRGLAAVLTEEGNILRERAPVLLEQIRELETALRSVDARRRQKLVIATPSYVSFALADVLAEFSLRHGNFQLSIETLEEDSAAAMVADGQADIGFLLALEGRAGAGCDIIARERVGLYASCRHPILSDGPPTLQQVSAAPLICLPRRDPLTNVIDEVLARWGVTGNPVSLQTANIRQTKHLMLKGDTIGCLFQSLVETELADGDLVELEMPGPDVIVEIRMVSSAAKASQFARTALLDLLSEYRRTG